MLYWPEMNLCYYYLIDVRYHRSLCCCLRKYLQVYRALLSLKCYFYSQNLELFQLSDYVFHHSIMITYSCFVAAFHTSSLPESFVFPQQSFRTVIIYQHCCAALFRCFEALFQSPDLRWKIFLLRS